MTISNRLLAVLLCLAPLLAWAQSDTIPRPQEVTNTQMLGFGASEVLDTYLSPEKYIGPELRYISHTVRQRTGSPWRRSTTSAMPCTARGSWQADGCSWRPAA